MFQTLSLLLNLFTFIMPVVKYYGNSMSPTLKDGQILIVNKMAEVKNGDIYAFVNPDEWEKYNLWCIRKG